MGNYEKWIGLGIGWWLGGPVGGILGGILGSFVGVSTDKATHSNASSVIGLQEMEIHLILLSAYVIKIDGAPTLAETNYLHRFLNTNFGEDKAAQRTTVISHCLNTDYDLTATCFQLRTTSSLTTRLDIIRLLFDIAVSDAPLNEREDYVIFRISGYLNIHDVHYKKLKEDYFAAAAPHAATGTVSSAYRVLGLTNDANIAEVRTAYRKLVLQYHPDRNKQASEQEKKELSAKFQQVQEAYEKILLEKGEKR